MSIKIYNSPRYRRMVSWWLKKEILEYPNVKISDAIQRKADALAGQQPYDCSDNRNGDDNGNEIRFGSQQGLVAQYNGLQQHGRQKQSKGNFRSFAV